MTIDQAIEALQAECCVPNTVFQRPKYQAINLGIEALRRIKKERQIENDPGWGHLSSETTN